MAQTTTPPDKSDYLLMDATEAICTLLPFISQWLPTGWSTGRRILDSSGRPGPDMGAFTAELLADNGGGTLQEIYCHNNKFPNSEPMDKVHTLQLVHSILGPILFKLSPEFIPPWIREDDNYDEPCFDGVGYQIRQGWENWGDTLTADQAEEEYRVVFETQSQAEEKLKELVQKTGVDTYSVRRVIYAAECVPYSK